MKYCIRIKLFNELYKPCSLAYLSRKLGVSYVTVQKWIKFMQIAGMVNKVRHEKFMKKRLFVVSDECKNKENFLLKLDDIFER